MERLHSKLTMKLRGENVPLKVIRLIDPQVDENQVLSSLLPFLKARYQTRPMIFHFDVTSSVSAPGSWSRGRFGKVSVLFPRVLILGITVSKDGARQSPGLGGRAVF